MKRPSLTQLAFHHPTERTVSRPPWLFLLAASLFVAGGLGYSSMLGDTLRFPDEHDYLAYARHLIDTGRYSLDGVTPDARRPPGYAMTLAPLTALIDSAHAVRGLHFVMMTVAAWWLAGMATSTSTCHGVPDPDTRRDRLAALLLVGFAAYPVLIYTAGTLFPQTLLGLMVVGGTMLVCGQALILRPLSTVALAGLIAGHAAEVSPTALMLVPVLGWHCVRPGRARHAAGISRWRILCVFVLCASVIPGAWLTRNLLVLERPVLFSVNLAENLDNAVLADDPLQTGAVRPPDDAIGYGTERLQQLFSEPAEYIEQLAEFFATSNRLHVDTEASALRDRIMEVTYISLLALIVLRIVLGLPIVPMAIPLSRAERMALALYVLTALFHALVFTRIRYRLPFDLLMMLPALNALRIVASVVVQRNRR